MTEQVHERPGEDATGPEVIAVLPLRDTVLFPQAILPLAAGRAASVRLVEEAVRASRSIAVFTQRDRAVEDPQQADLHRVGTVATVHGNTDRPGRRYTMPGWVCGNSIKG